MKVVRPAAKCKRDAVAPFSLRVGTHCDEFFSEYDVSIEFGRLRRSKFALGACFRLQSIGGP